jgi:hypothetical protein
MIYSRLYSASVRSRAGSIFDFISLASDAGLFGFDGWLRFGPLDHVGPHGGSSHHFSNRARQSQLH